MGICWEWWDSSKENERVPRLVPKPTLDSNGRTALVQFTGCFVPHPTCPVLLELKMAAEELDWVHLRSVPVIGYRLMLNVDPPPNPTMPLPNVSSWLLSL